MTKTFSLAELAHQLGANCRGDGQARVSRLAPLDDATAGEITFFTNPKFKDQLEKTSATAVVVSPQFADLCPTNCLIMDNPYLGFARLAQLFDNTPHYDPGVHATAVVSDNADIAADVYVGPYAVIGAGCKVGAGSIIHAHVTLAPNVTIGEQCVIYPHASLYHSVRLGHRVIVHSGAVIGSDGFGMARDEQGRWTKIPQLGTVIIGDDVEVGASTTIDRGALRDTEIANNAKIDNQIQIAHNVKIGERTAIAGCTGIAGSTTIGKDCMIAGMVGISGHLTITDQVILTAKSSVDRSLTEPGIYSSGVPVQPSMQWRRNVTRFKSLDELAKRVKILEKQVEGKNDE